MPAHDQPPDSSSSPPDNSPAADPGFSAPASRADFLLVTCQGGAEEILCQRQRKRVPQLTKGVWRRGLVTFRLSPPGSTAPAFDPPEDFFPDLVFARAVFRCFGQVAAAEMGQRCAEVVALAGRRYDRIHIWKRDQRIEADCEAIRVGLLNLLADGPSGCRPQAAALAEPGDLVLDIVIDSPERWWVGWHRAGRPHTCWPGGSYPHALPPDKVSRAWLKLDEALATHELLLPPGGRAVELGAAPGGACQRLLEAQQQVTAIDPALVDPRVAALPGFVQWRKRARDVRLKEFRGFDWIVADMNIDPVSTLEAIGRIVTAPGVHPQGIIATLKLPQWSRAEVLDTWLDQFRSWGFVPQARQLSSGGREVCVVARRQRLRPSRSTAHPATHRRDR